MHSAGPLKLATSVIRSFATGCQDNNGRWRGRGLRALRRRTGNKSKAEVARLAVRVVRATGLGGEDNAGAAKLAPFVRVKCEKTTFLTTASVQVRVAGACTCLLPAGQARRVSMLPHVRCPAICVLHSASVLACLLPQGPEPVWDDFFVFEVQSPAFALLKIKVFDKVTCWSPSMIGEVRLARPSGWARAQPSHGAAAAWRACMTWCSVVPRA